MSVRGAGREDRDGNILVIVGVVAVDVTVDNDDDDVTVVVVVVVFNMTPPPRLDDGALTTAVTMPVAAS
jgi:hypothetical protein